MFPSSNRVKLNRVALKDANELKQAPRRRRVPTSLKNVTADTVSEPVSVKDTACSSNEPIHTVFTDRVGPENVTGTAGHIPGEKPEENCVGTQKTNKRKNGQTFKSHDRKEFKLDGPCTTGKSRQSKPNTRAKSRMGRLRLSLTWCFCATCDSERTTFKQTRVHCSVKPRRISSKMSCKTKFNRKALAKSYIEAQENQILSDLEFGMGRSFSKSKSTQRNIESKTHGPLVAGTDQSRASQSRLKAMCTGWDPQRAANTGQVAAGTRSIHTGLSKIGRNTHSSPKRLACPKGSLRESVQASGCSLCGDCNYCSPRWKTSGKQGQNNTSPGPEHPTVEVKFKNRNRVTDTSKKITVWTDQYPKVTLCDIAQKFNTFSPDCGYILPDVLKTKAVHCFKQEMRAGFQFGHSCLGNNKHKNEEGALSKNRGVCPRVQPEMSICPSQSVTEHRSHLKEQADVQTFSNQTTCFHKSWTSEGSATSSASFLEGKCVKKGEWNPRMRERGLGKDLGLGSHFAGGEICTDKRIKLGYSGKNGVVLSTPHSESISCKNQENTDSDKGKKTCCWMSDDSQFISKHAVEGSSTSASAMTENCTKHHEEIYSPTKPNSTQMSPERFSERNQMDTDKLESFTCQRVCVYIRKSHFSCARTYISWPFFTRSSTLTAHVVTTACPAEPNVSSDKSYFAKDQNQLGLPRSQTNDMITDAPTGPPSDTAQQLTHPNEEKREEDGESILAERNGRRHSNMSSFCSDSKNMEFAPHLLENRESPGSPPSSMATHSGPIWHVTGLGMKAGSASSLPVNEPQTDSSFSTPSPSALGLTDWETATTLSPMSSPFTHGSLSITSDMTPSLPSASSLQRKVYCEDTQMSSCSSSSFAPPHNSDSSQSWKSSLLLPQDEKQSDEEPLTYSCPPELEPYYYTSPIKHDLERQLLNVHTGRCMETKLMLPPVLSPVTSPERLSRTNLLSENQDCSDEEEEEIRKCTCKCKIMPGFYLPPVVNGDKEDSKDCPQCSIEELEGVSTNPKPLTTPREPQSSFSSDGDVDDGNSEESQDETDWTDGVDQANKKSKQVPSNLKIKATLTSGDPCSSPSSDDEDFGAVSDEELSTRDDGSSPSKTAENEREQTKAEAAGGTQQGILDEFAAYKQDILLVDVIQDDPELFGNLPQKSLLNLGPTRVSETTKTRPTAVVKMLSRMDGASLEFEQRLPAIYLSRNSPDIKEESNRPWRPQCSSTSSKKQSSTCFASESQSKKMGQPDANNNHGYGSLERNQLIQTVNSQHNQIPPHMTMRNGPWITNTANTAELRRQKYSAYCRLYFSESLSCGFKMCRFKHVPVEGDEKFCIETVIRFTKNPMCLQKACAVFTGYYQNNPPGVYFSMPVYLSLLWALLKAGMVSDVFSVLNISTAHKIVPGHEFVLALFNLVREKSLMGSIPELMHLTFKMANAGLVLSLDCLDCVKNTPEVQQTANPNSLASVSGNSKLWTGEPFPECLNLAHVIVEIELCTKQEDWRRMGEIFRHTCQSSQRPNEVERISGRIAIALLSESKDKRSLPFAAFAETVCQSEDDDSLMKSFLGRIGVSLMLRYHKTHQWAKGRRVVEVLSISKIKYSTLKGLFGNEDGASRCCLVTVATELLLLSGSVEGALNTLRENDWFLSSCTWPCEPADVESRIRVLVRLAEKTSHRDTLDVLCNLPGLKEPNESIDISRYCPLFNSHLQVCVDRQTLPVASDTVDFMLSKSLAVDSALLQALLHKLGKQNFWLRAREVFRHSLSVGYYPGVSAPSGLMALIVPCQLREVELALAFEMFITVNGTAILQLSETTTDSLSIVLKRTQSCESEYLSASSRLLSAACIPQPKLIIHYTKVNCSREQVFTLDVSSARNWLRHNHLWANEVWSHWT